MILKVHYLEANFQFSSEYNCDSLIKMTSDALLVDVYVAFHKIVSPFGRLISIVMNSLYSSLKCKQIQPRSLFYIALPFLVLCFLFSTKWVQKMPTKELADHNTSLMVIN